MSTQLTSKNLIAEHSGTIVFVIVTACIFAGLYLAYEKLFLGTVTYYHYMEYCGTLASQFLTLIGIDHQFLVVISDLENLNFSNTFKNALKNDDLGINVLVNKGADAGPIFAVLVACIVAWPGKVLKKIVAIVAGIAIIFVLNILRIAGMFFVDMHAPMQFDLYKEIIFPTVMVIAALIYFLAWIRISGTHPDD